MANYVESTHVILPTTMNEHIESVKVQERLNYYLSFSTHNSEKVYMIEIEKSKFAFRYVPDELRKTDLLNFHLLMWVL